MIGAAHAGWRGALTGVIEATVEAMERLGAKRGEIRAAIGPMIRQSNYEVGPDLISRFAAEDRASNRFFSAAPRDGHALFDLGGYVAARLARAGIGRIEDLGCAPMPIRHVFSAIAAPRTAPKPITAGTSTRSHWCERCNAAGRVANRHIHFVRPRSAICRSSGLLTLMPGTPWDCSEKPAGKVCDSYCQP